MIYPSINDFTKDGKMNKYALVIAAAKCARVITDEYVNQRERAESRIAKKEVDKPLVSMIREEYRDEKAVKVAVGRLYDGRFKIVDKDGETLFDNEDKALIAEE